MTQELAAVAEPKQASLLTRLNPLRGMNLSSRFWIALVIVAAGESYALLPRAAAEKVRERAPELIVVDHGQAGETSVASTGNAEDDAYYAQFQIPDDLVW